MNEIKCLPSGALLRGGTYRITRFIGSGGFGCTYEAFHTELEEKVAIKEFFVKDFCNRDETTSRVSVATQSKRALVEKLRLKFKEEAKAMFRLRHPGIVRVSDVFEENGTVYYVMDFIEGRSLQVIVEEEGRLPERRALKYIRQVADALKYVHGSNRLHLDVKPGNIMIDGSDNAILIDFGASKQYDEENGENTSTLVGKTPGYAPLEQMSNKVVRFFPATDIYALGATMYKLLTGVTPPDAAMLASGGDELSPLPFTVSGNTRRAVSAAMSLKKDDRPQTIDGFLNILGGGSGSNGDSTVLDEKGKGGCHSEGDSHDKGTGGSNGEKPSSDRSKFKAILIAACVIAGLVAGYFLLRGLVSGVGQAGTAVPGDTTSVAQAPDDAASLLAEEQSPVSSPSTGQSSGGAGASPSREPDSRVKEALDSKDEEIAALQRQIKAEREQRTKDSLAYVRRRQHIKDSIAAARRAEQEAAEQEAARKAAEAKSTTGFINGHQWVDLGLSVKWSTCNVGASSPSDYGGYYAWGETRTKSEYNVDNSSTYGVSMGDISGDSRYDAAMANWGGSWRLPTQEEMRELIDRCTWTWTSQGGHDGYRVTGPNGSSIFLPAAGYRGGSSLYYAGDIGYYWSSAPGRGDTRYAYDLYFTGSGHYLVWSDRDYGRSVRPVSD